MSTKADLERQLASLLTRAEALHARIQQIVEWPEPESKTLWWQRRFTPQGLIYTYGAVRTETLWFVTGGQSKGTSYEWDQLVEEHLRHNLGGVWGATGYERIDPV